MQKPDERRLRHVDGDPPDDDGIGLKVKGLDRGLRAVLSKLEKERELRLAQRVETEEKIRLDVDACATHVRDVSAWEGRSVYISRPGLPEELYHCRRVGVKSLRLTKDGKEVEIERTTDLLVRGREERLLDILDEKVARANARITETEQRFYEKINAVVVFAAQRQTYIKTVADDAAKDADRKIASACEEAKRELASLARTQQDLLGFRSRVYDTLRKGGLINPNRRKEDRASDTKAVPAAKTAATP